MPRQDRLPIAVATVDVQLSEWAASQGLLVSAGKVNRWRRAGLVPEPTRLGNRPPGAAPGKRPRTYSSVERDTAEQVVAFLSTHARRGRSLDDLALLIFAAGLRVTRDALVKALRHQVARMRMLVDNLLLPAPVEADPDFSEVSSRALASATRSIDVNNDFARWVRRLIGKSGRPHTDDELHMVMTALIGTAQGEPPEEHDVEALSSLLTAFGGHGLLESINDGVPPVLASLDEWRTALETSVQDQFDLPSDITLGELEQARTLCTNLGLIMSLVPRESMHYLGGPALTSLWQPDNPQRLAQILIWAVNAQRAGRIDAEPMFAAAREVGWLPPNE